MPIDSSKFRSNSLTGTVRVTNGFANISLPTAFYALEGNINFNILVRTDGFSGTTVYTSPTVTLRDPSSIVSLTANTASVNEGDLVAFTLVTANVLGAANLYYSVFPVTANVTADDFVANTGLFSITNNAATFTLKANADVSLVDETGETFKVQVRTVSPTGNAVYTSSNVVILDTYKTYNILGLIESSSSPLTNGDNVTFTFTATNVPSGTLFYYSTTGNVSTFTSNSGSFALNSVSNTFVIANPQPSGSYNVVVKTGSQSGPIVRTSNTMVVNYVPPPPPYFIAQGPTSGVSEGGSIALDSSGNMYQVGSVAGSTDIIISKYSVSTGLIVWQYKIDSGQDDAGFGIHIDSSDNIFVVGRTGGGAGFPAPGTPGGRIWISKFNTSGTIQWQRRITQLTLSNGYSEAYNIVSDSSGNLYIAGRYNETGYVIKLNSSGIVQWFKSSAMSTIASLAIDSSDNIYVIGSKFAPSSSNYAASIVKLDSSGNQLWHKTWTGDNAYGNFAGGITISASGYVYVSFSANTASEGFLAKLSADGTQQWQRKIASPGGYETSWLPFSTLSVDSSDNVYWIINCQYNYSGAVGFQNQKAIIAKYNSSGTQQWQRHMYVSGTAYPNAFDYLKKIKVDNSNNFYVTGQMNSINVLARLPTDGTLTTATYYTVGTKPIIYNVSTLTESAGTITLSNSGSTSFSTITSYSEEATAFTANSTAFTANTVIIG
jgi:hypothetical protein